MTKSNDGILSEKWINFTFFLPFPKPENQSNEEFLDFLEKLKLEVLSVATGGMMSSDSYVEKKGWFKKELVFKGSVNKTITARTLIKNNEYAILLSFNEYNEQLGNGLRYKKDDDPREYNFSPSQYLKFINIGLSIEFGLIAHYGFKQLDVFVEEGRTLIMFLYDENNKPLIRETDGIGNFTYPFEKRVELYQKHPEVEKELFPNWNLKEFVNWIYTKKDKSPYDKQFCEDIQKIMRDMKLDLK